MTTIVTSTVAIEDAVAGIAPSERHAGRILDAINAHGHTVPLLDRAKPLKQQAALAWKARCTDLGLRKGTKGRQAQLEAFLQGTIAVLTAGRYMSHAEANNASFLVSIDRGEELVARWEAAE